MKYERDLRFLVKPRTIAANGKVVDCYVFEIPEEVEDGLYPRWWIDKGRHVVLRGSKKSGS
jgi:hypothetical protein